ncbi:MAG: hypothetical protein DA330_06145 [Nitrososphaera sp.]|nr:hypothetical protein [Nitrososphaera sp.]
MLEQLVGCVLLKCAFDSKNVMEQDLERMLQGKTLMVYLYLLKKKESSGIREVQRELGLSSPSVAEYQIEKLIGLGLASRDNYGRVFVTRKVKVKALEQYVSFGRFTVPRMAFYATVFALVPVLLFAFDSWNIYAVIVSAAAAGIFSIEAWKMWKFSLYEKATKDGVSEKTGSVMLVMPSVAALAVGLAAAVFMSGYVQSQPPVQALVQPIPGSSAVQPTIEEVVDISRQKVAIAEKGVAPAMAAMMLAGVGAAGFLAYTLVSNRCKNPVLVAEQN